MILRYGWHGFFTLQSLIEIDVREQIWKNYVADVIGTLTTRIYRWSGDEDFEIPLYSELFKPQKSKETAQDIKQRVIDRLTQ